MTKTIRSIERGLLVLRYLQDHAPASLEQIHVETGLPRATTARILLTFQQEEIVRRGISDGLYRNSVRIAELSAALKSSDRLAELAGPLMIELCRKILWPSDLYVRNGIYMELAETTRAITPMPVPQAQWGERVNIPGTAVGRTYLAFCPDNERGEILAELEKIGAPITIFYRTYKTFERQMVQITKRGYADRHPLSGARPLPLTNYYDGLSAIAVPLMTDDKMLGCLNLLWNRKAGKPAEFAARFLDDLSETRDRIVSRFLGE